MIAVVAVAGLLIYKHETRSPTARCSDGTLSYAKHHQGACSWHGGVIRWYR